MTTSEKNTAMQELMDIQHEIESKEEDWTIAYNAGKPTEKIDAEINRLINIRRGVERLMIGLGIEFDRKDYRTIDQSGSMKVQTIWYLI